MSAMERRLAAIRVKSIAPGSLDIAYERPLPIVERQTSFDVQVSPDDIAEDLIREIDAAREGSQLAQVLSSGVTR
jgi:hypothetical protein